MDGLYSPLGKSYRTDLLVQFWGARRGGRHGGRLAVAREAREVAVVFFFDTDKVSVGAVSFFRLTAPIPILLPMALPTVCISRYALSNKSNSSQIKLCLTSR